jgi:hypothetical protein
MDYASSPTEIDQYDEFPSPSMSIFAKKMSVADQNIADHTSGELI